MNELRWLEHNRHYENIDESKLKNIFYFTLIWNIFEKECCENFAEIGFHPRCIAEKLTSKINTSVLNDVCGYFKDRYVANNKTKTIFNDFKFGKDANDGKVYKDFVRKTLLANNASNKDKIQSLLYIAFRLRNNLYHGIKEVSKLYDQNENFKQINLLLMEIIDKK